MFDRLLDTFDDTPRIEQSQQKRHEYHLIKKERKIDGHILFSYNTVTGEIKQADVVYCKDIDFMTLQPLHKPRVVVESNCIYRQALNKRNFIKRLHRESIL